MTNQRDVSLDYAKGFAILLIVIFHIYGYTGRHENSIVYSFCQNVQIVIFIFVSGVLLGKSNKKIRIKAKAIRLLVPFVSFYIIWGIIDSQNFTQFLLDEFKYGYWFVLVLFEIILSFAFLSYISKIAKIHIIVMHVFFYVVLSLYELLIPQNSVLNILLCTNLFWHYYPFFLIGVYSQRINKIMALRYTPIYLSFFILSQYYYFSFGMRSLAPLCNLSSLLFFMSLFENKILPFKVTISQFGVFSMQIYLLHFILLSFIYQLIPIQDNDWIEFLWYLILSVIIIVIIISISKIIMRNEYISLLLFGIIQQNNKHYKT